MSTCCPETNGVCRFNEQRLPTTTTTMENGGGGNISSRQSRGEGFFFLDEATLVNGPGTTSSSGFRPPFFHKFYLELLTFWLTQAHCSVCRPASGPITDVPWCQTRPSEAAGLLHSGPVELKLVRPSNAIYRRTESPCLPMKNDNN